MWQVLGRAKAHTSVLGPFVTQSDGRAETRTADCVRVRTSLYYPLAQPCTGSPKGRCSVCVPSASWTCACVCVCVPLVVFCNRIRVINNIKATTSAPRGPVLFYINQAPRAQLRAG